MSEKPRFHPGKHETTITTRAANNGFGVRMEEVLKEVINEKQKEAKETDAEYREPTEREVQAFRVAEDAVDEFVREYTGLDPEPFDEKMFQVMTSENESTPHFTTPHGFIRVNERDLDNPLGMLDFLHEVCHEITHAKSRFQTVFGSNIVVRSGLRVDKNQKERWVAGDRDFVFFQALNEGITSYIELKTYEGVMLRSSELKKAFEDFWKTNQPALEEKFFMKKESELLLLINLSGKNVTEDLLHSYQRELTFVYSTMNKMMQVEPGMSLKDAELVFMDAYFKGELKSLKKLLKKIYGKDALRFVALWGTYDLYDNEFLKLFREILNSDVTEDRAKAVSAFVARMDAIINHCYFCGAPGQRGRKKCQQCQQELS